MIKSVEELIKHIPNYVAKTGDEYSAPCPFCAQAEGKHSYMNAEGVPFFGEDRLIKFAHKNLFFCRFCKQDGRGGGQNGGVYNLRDIAEVLGFHVSRDIGAESARDERDVKGLIGLTFDSEVEEWHQKVQREYWYSIGIDDAIIDKYKLGYAKPSNRTEYGHIIPMRLTNAITGEILKVGGGIVPEMNAYACEYRRIINKNPQARKTEKPQFLFKGDSKRNGWLWLVANNPLNKTIIIAEGSKDALSALEMGYENVAVSFGADHITLKHIEFLKQQGFERVILAGDDDAAGHKFSENVFYYCHMADIEAFAINWEAIELEGNDLNDILTTFLDKAFNIVENNLRTYDISTRKLASLQANTKPKRRLQGFAVDPDDLDIIDPKHYTKIWDDSAQMTTLEILRGTGEGSLYQVIRDFYKNYQTYRGDRGAILSVNVPPGLGKTYIAAQISQEIVNLANIEYKKTAQQMENDIAILVADATKTKKESDRVAIETQIGDMRTKLKNLSRIAVAWYGPFKAAYEDLQHFPVVENEDWFNFEARQDDNCMNIDAVRGMGDNNHRIMEYCQKHCKFSRNCAYMKQRKQQQQHPAVYYRHQQLQMEAASNLKLVVVDESPVHVVEDSVIELRFPKMKFGGSELLTKEENKYIGEGIDVLKTVTKQTNKSDAQPIYGNLVLKLVDEEFIARGSSLREWLGGITENMLENCEPNYDDSHGQLIPELRWVQAAIQCIIAEYPEYEQDLTCNSYIHIDKGTFIIMPLELKQFHFPQSVPIVLLDATGMPSLLRAMFNREVIEFNPIVQNKELVTKMVTGSDYTKGHVTNSLQQIRTLELGGDLIEEDLSPYAFKHKVNGKVPILRDILDLLRIETRLHAKTLFVTYKSLSSYLKDTLNAKAEELGIDLSKVTFAHYGSLRGTNAYEKYDKAILFGAYRIPYNVVWRKAMMWSRLLGNKKTIEYEPIPLRAFYPGTNIGHEVWSFEDTFTQEYLNMIEVGELRQCADRIRPHNGGEKHLMAVMNRPCLPFVDEIVTYTSYLTAMKDSLFLQEETLPEWVDNTIYDFIVQDYLGTSLYPALSYAQRMLNLPNLGRAKYNKIVKYVKQQQLGG